MNVMTRKTNEGPTPAPAGGASLQPAAGRKVSFLNRIRNEELIQKNDQCARLAPAASDEGLRRSVQGNQSNLFHGGVGRRKAAEGRRTPGRCARFEVCQRTGAGRGVVAFTLVELLIVISIIGVLSAFILSVVGAAFKNKYINTAKSEMAQLELALERYKAAYGVYPPSGTNFLVTPLVFELEGVTNDLKNLQYVTLDGQWSVASARVQSDFAVAGFLNCDKGGGEDYVPAKVFLPDLRANQIGTFTNPSGSGNPAVPVLKTSVGGPDLNYQPLGGQNLNPWRYNSVNPTNNPGSYDLWIQLKISGKTNLIDNWSKQVQVNNPNYP